MSTQWKRGARRAPLALICALIGGIGLSHLLHQTFVSPAGLVILHHAGAPWIRVQEELGIKVQQWGSRHVPVTRFVSTFSVPSAGLPAGTYLAVRALREYAILLDGEPLTEPLEEIPADRLDLSRDWKTVSQIPMVALERPGEHTLAVDVRNPLGPALLSLRLVGAGFEFSTADHWIALREGTPPLATVRATEALAQPVSADSGTPWRNLVTLRVPLAIFAVCGAGVFWATRRHALRHQTATWLSGPGPIWVAFGSVTAFWVALFVVKFQNMPMGTGFDARPHLSYLKFLRTTGSLPFPSDGWAMYHPPLFYFASDLVSRGFRALGSNDPLLPLKMLPAAAGLGSAWVSGLFTQQLLRGDRRATLFAIGLGGVLPMNCYIAGYFTNEGLHAFFAACLLLVAVRLLVADDLRPARIVLFSTLVGLALLTKHTAFVVGGLASLFVLVRILHQEDNGPRIVLGRLLLLGAPMLLVAGWYYLRTWVELGTPWQLGWDARGPGRIWWSAPGFHTLRYFFDFGESLVHPFFSGHYSFWDGLYSTLWGDGLLAGRTGWEVRHGRWAYDFMTAGYLLALPATVLIGVGVARCARLAWREPHPGRRAALGLPLVVASTLCFMILLVNLGAPGISQVKAFYGLAATSSIVLFFGAGAGALDGWLDSRGWQPARYVLVAWYAIFVGCLAASFLA